MKTLVIGASLNPERYSYKAVKLLKHHGHEVYAYGIQHGYIDDVSIGHEMPETGIDTVTLYLQPARQKEFYNQLLKLNPRRIIFNPGTENSELEQLANAIGIQTENACTLVLLNTGQY